MQNLPYLLLLVHSAITIFFAGIIWFVQIVHYPLLAFVGKNEITNYEQQHTKKVMLPAKIFLCLELISGVLLIWLHPKEVSLFQIILGLVLIALIWYETWFVQVPCHKMLCDIANPKTLNRLIKTNLIRTVAYSLRILLVLWMLMNILKTA